MNITPEQVKQEREAFEAWLRDDHMDGLDDAGEWDDERGCYVEFPVHMAYCGWQAGRALLRSAGDGWQDIATAPKDGTPMLVFHNRMVIEAWYSTSWHRFVQSETGGHNGIYPQHWMPLPHPPVHEGGGT